MRIYLDHNAGAPIRPEVRAAIVRFAEDGLANPAAIHRDGQRARRALEQARAEASQLIGANPPEVIFTSGGTESNNLAIRGAAGLRSARRKIITSAIEHSSILEPLDNLAARGFEVIRVAPDRAGHIAPEKIAEAVDSSTILVTIGLVNAEVGTIQDAAAIADAVRSAGALFHLDAVQAAGRIPIRARDLGCDLMTLSGHKLGAPAGIGALYVRSGVSVSPLMLGGPQESGVRAGTPNLLGAIALGAAAAACVAHFEEESRRIAALADRLRNYLAASIPGLRLNGSDSHRIANTLNLTFPGVLGESMLIALDLEGVAVSMGSACAAGAVEPSHVLLAMGLSHDEARSSLRLSLGWNTGSAEAERAAEIIARVWRRVRAAETSIPITGDRTPVTEAPR
jgi:cysteine desulfurase